MSLDRLRRVTDLFNEGTALELGMDEDSQPVVVWVNKLNSFEIEEARRDGVAARALRMQELTSEGDAQRLNLDLNMRRWSDEELADYRLGQMTDEMYLEVINDLEAEPGWGEKIATLRRLPDLLRDSKAPEDDKRWAQLNNLNQEYLEALRTRAEKKQKQVLRDLKKKSRDELIEDYVEEWQNRLALDDFINERRVTEIFMALRDCQATPSGPATDRSWDHSGCDHRKRLLDERSQVRDLPEPVLARIVEVLEGITVSDREAGNSGAPASSFGSSEQPSAAEQDSTPSIPAEMPPAAPTT